MNEQNDYMLTRAKSAVMARDFVLASRLFKTILRSEPDNIDVRSQLAASYVRAGEDEKALTEYQEILKTDSNNFSVLNSLGGIYRRLGKYQESIVYLERALATGKNPNAIYYNMGQTYKLMGQYADAEQCFKDVIEEDPNDVLAYNHLGAIQATLGHHQTAVQSYQRALQVDPNHPILHYNMAVSYEALGKFQDAKVSYENALRSKPGWIEAMCRYADLLIKLNKTDEACETLQQANRIEKNNPQILNTLGSLSVAKKKLIEAEKYYNTVLRLDSDNFEALMGLANVYEKQGKYFDAVEILQRLEYVQPETPAVQLLYAKNLIKLDRLHEAGEKIKVVRDKAPQNLEALNLLAQLFITKDETERLDDCFKTIAKINPTYVQHYKDCAQVYLQKNKFDEAGKCIRTYLTKETSDPYAYEILGKVEEGCRNYKKALNAYQKAMSLCPDDPDIIEAVARLNRYDNLAKEAETPINVDEAESLKEETLDYKDDSIFDFHDDLSETDLLDIELPEIESHDYSEKLEKETDDFSMPLMDIKNQDEPIDFPNVYPDAFDAIDPYADRRHQDSPEEEQTFAPVKDAQIDTNFEDEFPEDFRPDENRPSNEKAKQPEFITGDDPDLAEDDDAVWSPIDDDSVPEAEPEKAEAAEDSLIDEHELTIEDKEIDTKDIKNKPGFQQIIINSPVPVVEEELEDAPEESDSLDEFSADTEAPETLDEFSADTEAPESLEKLPADTEAPESLEELPADTEEVDDAEIMAEENAATGDSDLSPDDFAFTEGLASEEQKTIGVMPLPVSDSDAFAMYMNALQNKLRETGTGNFFPEMSEMIDMITLAGRSMNDAERNGFLETSDCHRLDYMIERLSGKSGLLAAAEACNATGYAESILKEQTEGKTLKNFLSAIKESIGKEEVSAEFSNMVNSVAGRYQELLNTL